MSDSPQKVKIVQEFMDEPINVKPSGFRAWIVPVLVASIALSTCATEINTRNNTELQKQRLEIAKKQYKLDSLKLEYMKMHQK